MVKNCDRGLENAAGGLRRIEDLAVFTALNRSGSLSLKKDVIYQLRFGLYGEKLWPPYGPPRQQITYI